MCLRLFAGITVLVVCAYWLLSRFLDEIALILEGDRRMKKDREDFE